MTQRIQTATLDNGLQVVVEEMPWLPSVSFELLIPFGSVSDPLGAEGSATVLHDWLFRGAGELGSKALSEALDSLGVRRGGGAGGEYGTLTASLLADALPQALNLYGKIVKRPLLAEPEFEPARLLALEELASIEDNPAQRMFLALSAAYFASAHGRSPCGTEEGLRALTPEGVREDFARRLGPQGSILSVAGGVAFEQVVRQAEVAFGDWQGSTVALPHVARQPAHAAHVPAETAQVQIGLAWEAIAPGHAGWYENVLVTSVLSGGMGARLFTEVREKRGLVYGVAAAGRAVKNHGYTLAYAGTTPERAETTLEVLLYELRRVREGVTAAELERARTGTLSNLVMQAESSSARAGALARDLYLLGRPRSLLAVKDELNRLGVGDVNRFLAGRPAPEFTLLTLGPKAPGVVEAR